MRVTVTKTGCAPWYAHSPERREACQGSPGRCVVNTTPDRRPCRPRRVRAESPWPRRAIQPRRCEPAQPRSDPPGPAPPAGHGLSEFAGRRARADSHWPGWLTMRMTGTTTGTTHLPRRCMERCNAAAARPVPGSRLIGSHRNWCWIVCAGTTGGTGRSTSGRFTSPGWSRRRAVHRPGNRTALASRAKHRVRRQPVRSQRRRTGRPRPDTRFRGGRCFAPVCV